MKERSDSHENPNVARLKKAGENFEIAVDSDKAMKYKEGAIEDIREVLKSEHIYSDVRKGLLTGAAAINNAFGTEDEIEAARQILDKGEIQLTGEYRRKLNEDKIKQIITLIARYGTDPRTGFPHPYDRIKRAIDESKVKIDLIKPAKKQLNDITKSLQPVLPIKIASKLLSVQISGKYAGKCYAILKQYGEIKKENWLNEGSFLAELEVPAGIVNDFFDKMNDYTHGEVETKVLKEL